MKSENAELFDNIGKIDEAITARLKISFQYCEYDINKKLQPYTSVQLSPYRILLHEGIYYLIGYCEDEFNKGLRSYKIDHLKNVDILSDRRQSFAKVNEGISEDEFIKQILEDLLNEKNVLIERFYDYRDAGVISLIRKYGQLLEEEYRGDGIYVKAYVPMEIYGAVTPDRK